VSRGQGLRARTYAGFLRLYPRSFRELFEEDMRRTFATRLAEADATAGTLGRTRFLAVELFGVLRSAVSQRLGGRAADHGMRLGSPLKSVPTLNTRRKDPMSILAQELRHGLRRLTRNPGFTLASVVTLALGIGATTAVYSVVHSIVLRPLPYPESDRLVWLDHAGPGIGTARGLGMTRGLYAYYRGRVTAFEDMATWTPMEVNITGDEPERVRALATTPELFRTLGVRAEHGRVFGAGSEDVASGTVVISHRFWMRRYGGDPDAVGRVLSFTGVPLEIIGVMPAGFAFPDPHVDLWTPVTIDPGLSSFGGFSWQGIARLAPGVTRAAAEAEVRALIPGLRERFGVGRMLDDSGLTPVFPSLKEEVVREAERTLWILLGSVCFVLLLACANVANLVLVRAEGRQRETAVRRALGAGRLDVLRYHLAEGVLIALAGGALGVALAGLAVRILVATGPETLPRLAEVSVSPAVLGFALLLVAGTAVVFALVPALRRGPSMAATMKSGDRRASAGRRAAGRGALVVTQVALALVLLIATGLMSRSFVHLVRYDPGFDSDSRLTFRVGLSPHAYPDDRSSAAFHREALDGLAAIPGVEVAGATTCLPLCDRWGGTQLSVEGRPDDPSSVPRVVAIRRVNESYFEALGIRLVTGRLPNRFDHESETGAAVISREVVDAYWPDEDPLGRRFQPGSGGSDWYTVVGVVADTPINGYAADPPPIAYLPLVYGSDGSNSPYELSYVLRTSVPPQRVIPAVREVIRSLDADVPISDVATMEEIVAAANVQTAFTTVMLGIAAGIALLLGVVGIYGVISYAVGRRTREIGIRLALGARAGQVTRRILRDEGRVTALGLVVGLAGAFALTRLMRSLLFGVSPTDPVSFAGAAGLLAIVALLATWVPARRSARIDPARTLRAE